METKGEEILLQLSDLFGDERKKCETELLSAEQMLSCITNKSSKIAGFSNLIGSLPNKFIAPEKSSRQKLMNTLAGIYASKTLPDEWVVFDMAAYNRVNTADNAPKISEGAKQNYINLAIDSLNQSYTLTTDRAKAEVIMNAIGVDSTKLYDYALL